MKPAIRTNVDGEQDYYSELSALACDPAGDMTRQEFKADADINTLLRRYGVSQARDLIYGEVDYEVDLRAAYAAAGAAQDLFNALPAKIKEQYPSWYHLAQHLAEVGFDVPEPKEADVPSADGGSAASVSAPVGDSPTK